MMRELKFRAWHKPTQLMDEVVLIDFYNEKIGILYADPVMQCESIQKYNFNEVEIMQYTGLKDRIGVEIFEGDIVEYTLSMFGVTEYKKTGKVEFYDSAYMLNDGQDSREWLDDDNVNEWKIEVIGNIYKDSEFLEVE